MARFLSLGILLLYGAFAFAEETKKTGSPTEIPINPIVAQVYRVLDFSMAMGSQRWVPALSANMFYGFGRTQKFHMGFGLRASAFVGTANALVYSTADAALAESGRINSVTLDETKTYSINAVLHFKYEVAPRWEIGMNLDLLGFGFGGPKVGHYNATDPAQSGPEQVRPSGFNLFLGGSRDRGQIGTEFYVAFELARQWWIRGGYSRFTSEVTSDSAKDFGNSRFRLTNDLIVLSAQYRI